MTEDEPTKPVMPQTLGEAHEALARIRPPRQAPLAEWLAYHQHSAALYAEIAEIDRGHHHESLYWADHEQERAKGIEGQLPTCDDQSDQRDELR
jgi:hypothetical protein